MQIETVETIVHCAHRHRVECEIREVLRDITIVVAARPDPFQH